MVLVISILLRNRALKFGVMKSIYNLILLSLIWLPQLNVSNGTPLSASISPGISDMALLQAIDVKCGRSGMTVHVTFDKPFTGVIYSKGSFYDPKCNYVPHGGTRSQREFSFLIPIDSCGTSGHLKDPTPKQDMYFENTIVIQNDPLIQEVWDTARSLKCAWKHSFSKSVKTDPIEVEGPQMVNVDFDSRSVNTIMQIQKGKSPFSSPANGYIYIGDDTSLVIYLQDPTGELDVNAVSCTASSDRSEPVELVDRNGCVTRPKLMTPFYKHKNPKGIDADLMLYSYFKAFRIGDDADFKISCQLEVCEGSCLEPCALGPYKEFSKSGRNRRDATEERKSKLVIEIANDTVILSKFETFDEIQSKEDELRQLRQLESKLTVLNCGYYGAPMLSLLMFYFCSVLAFFVILYKIELNKKTISKLVGKTLEEKMQKFLPSGDKNESTKSESQIKPKTKPKIVYH